MEVCRLEGVKTEHMNMQLSRFRKCLFYASQNIIQKYM